jgi:hypothetical protein
MRRIEDALYGWLHARKTRRLRDYYDTHDTSPELRRATGGPIRGGTRLVGEEGCTYRITVNAPTDPVAAGKEIAARLREYQRSTGRPLRFD